MSPPTLRTLYLVRHAIAAVRGAEWPDDRQRPLTDRGKARMQLAVSGLVALGARIDTVLTSPLVRAVETAEIIVEGLDSVPALAVTASLAPGSPPEALVRALADQAATSTIAIVGHEPDLGELAAWLIGAREPLLFKKGGACRIDWTRAPQRGTGQLIWHATPAMLRALGGQA